MIVIDWVVLLRNYQEAHEIFFPQERIMSLLEIFLYQLISICSRKKKIYSKLIKTTFTIWLALRNMIIRKYFISGILTIKEYGRLNIFIALSELPQCIFSPSLLLEKSSSTSFFFSECLFVIVGKWNIYIR